MRRHVQRRCQQGRYPTADLRSRGEEAGAQPQAALIADHDQHLIELLRVVVRVGLAGDDRAVAGQLCRFFPLSPDPPHGRMEIKENLRQLTDEVGERIEQLPVHQFVLERPSQLCRRVFAGKPGRDENHG